MDSCHVLVTDLSYLLMEAVQQSKSARYLTEHQVELEIHRCSRSPAVLRQAECRNTKATQADKGIPTVIFCGQTAAASTSADSRPEVWVLPPFAAAFSSLILMELLLNHPVFTFLTSDLTQHGPTQTITQTSAQRFNPERRELAGRRGGGLMRLHVSSDWRAPSR